MYVFEGKWIEVVYTVRNFKHLTGVESNLSARSFFADAVNHRLSARDIYFTTQHPYDLCIRKVAHLNSLTSLATGEGFLLKEINTSTQTFKFGATDLEFTLLFNRPKDSSGIVISDSFHVESLRDEDCFARSSDVFEITHILSKKNNHNKYDTLHYMDGRYSLLNIPNNILPLIDTNLINLYLPEQGD